jgi:hypothetical protein
MRSSANQAASIALTSAPQASGEGSRVYGISGRIRLEWAGAGDWGGFVYDHIDARTYREVRLNRTVPGRPGEIVLAEIVRGVRREVFRAPRSQGTADPELFVTLRRENDRTIASELGVLSNIQVRQAAPTVPVQAGLFAAWNMVRFDDVFVYEVQQQ